MVELRTVAPAVEGSNPSTHPKFPTKLFPVKLFANDSYLLLGCHGRKRGIQRETLQQNSSYSWP